ncbi:ABC transporter permease [Sporosarcina sp. ACRSL]|nr:ABC transporter permease [Sporosarcina sp. ACRSL]MCG7344002.1 ABC transporter permease [Sporosarcina sp. ACRSL]
MQSYILKRLLGVIPVVFIILVFVFLMLQLSPGNPVMLLLPENATSADIEEAMKRFGFDRPLYTQFFDFLAGALVLDFGNSMVYSESVLSIVLERLPATLELAFSAIFVALIVGVPLGIIASLRPGTLLDRLASTAGLFGVSLPNFWLGLILIIFLGGTLGWFPTGGRVPFDALQYSGPTNFLLLDTILHGDWNGFKVVLSHLILPAITLGTAVAGMIMRITRSSMLEVMNKDFIRTARSKGINEITVTSSHIFRNALIPIVTIVGLELGSVIGGSIIVETVFGWPGMGSLLITSIGMRDYFLVQGIVFFIALTYVFLNLIVDISYKFIDPRIRY